MAALLLALMGACSGGSSGGGVAGTPIPTAPAGLPALDAPSDGFNIVLSGGMVAPAVSVSPVPRMTGGDIIDQDAAIRLGKALFWDVQSSSDGQIACASCHFMAGADNRVRNTVHPGAAPFTFSVVAGPGAIFTLSNFSGGLQDDVAGSSGVLSRQFVGISSDPNDPVDICTPLIPTDGAQAALAAAGQRLVTGRNTPPTVGAVFYLDNFWDGRASHRFNGQSPLGGTQLGLPENASLASQAVGPPLSDVEMSCAGRSWNGANSIGAKLVLRTPLAMQLVDLTDSVLGPLSNAPSNGLTAGFPDRLCTYADLIAAAFGKKGLANKDAVQFYIDNFSSIWGQAVQAYEETLVPDQTPYDLGTLTPVQVQGLQAMRDRGCMACHVEPEFSDATVRHINANGGPGQPKLVGGLAGGDQGFHNIGASLTAADRGRAASPGGVYHASDFNEGAFKTSGLRNVRLTAPYMHNGSIATLEDVMLFYNGTNQANLQLGFNPAANAGINGGNRAAVAEFLRNGLTDPRVLNESAPFDHPSLLIPNGLSLAAVGRAGR